MSYILLAFLLVSCDKADDFKVDYENRIGSADKIEFVMFKWGQKKSKIIVDKEELDFLKDLIEPKDLVQKKLTDDTNFPIDIILYQDNKVVGQMGIEFGHIQYLYYKGDKNFEYKTEMNYRLGMYIQDL